MERGIVAANFSIACYSPTLQLVPAINGNRRALSSLRLSLPATALTQTCRCGSQRRVLLATANAVGNSSTIASPSKSNARELVDALLSLVDGSDRGTSLGEQEREKVEVLMGCLEKHCTPEPLKSPFLFGEWDVIYSSNPTATGGYYRSAIGRTLLKTKQMKQIVKEPNFVSNKVSFAAFGVLDGEVSLQGELEPLDTKWIKIIFNSPRLKIGSVEFQYGGSSSVKISIIYLDERVRLGRGSRGSLFVFRRH